MMDLPSMAHELWLFCRFNCSGKRYQTVLGRIIEKRFEKIDDDPAIWTILGTDWSIRFCYCMGRPSVKPVIIDVNNVYGLEYDLALLKVSGEVSGELTNL